MKKFIKEIVVFTLIPLIFLIISLLLFFYISRNMDYKLNVNIKEIYIGDSHIKCGVNDSLLNNSKNVSRYSEPFYFTYYKLRKLIDENSSIKKVYLGASYHNLSYSWDTHISGEYSATLAGDYFYVLPLQEQFRVLRWNFKNFPTYVKGIFSISSWYLLHQLCFDYGSYSNNFSNTMALKASMDKRLYFQYYKDKGLNSFSEINLLYLTKIIDLCKEDKLDLVVLNAPLHPYYKSKIPTIYINKFNELVNTNNLNAMAFDTLTFGDSCFAKDGDHLSVKGAFQLTKEISRIKAIEYKKSPQ